MIYNLYYIFYMFKNHFCKIATASSLIIILTACGGGGSEGDTDASNKITEFNVIPAQYKTVFVKAGDTLPLRMNAETFGPNLSGMSWTSAASSANTVGTLQINDPNCNIKEFSSRPVPGSNDVKVATGTCETFATIPESASGAFMVTASVNADDGTQRVEQIPVTVIPKPPIIYDFTLETDVVGNVALGQPVRLIPHLISSNAFPSTGSKTYEWTMVSAPTAALPSGGLVSSTDEALVMMRVPGTYVYMGKVTVKFGDKEIVKTALTKLEISSPSDGGSLLGFVTKAKTEQPTVFVGSPANLVAEFTVNPDVVLSSVGYKWTQLSGPKAKISGELTKSIFIVPTDKGTMVFSVNVTVVSNGVIEMQTAIVVVNAESNEATDDDPTPPPVDTK